MLLVCVLVACHENEPAHEHVPDSADCQHVQYCIECGEMISDHGLHDYPEQPNAEKEGYLFYICRICGEIEIYNMDGSPVVPIE